MGSIEAKELTKNFGPARAVDNLTFSVQPGEVTGFLGRNGAGKTTTLRMILGLISPTSGMVTVDGRRYTDLVDPLRHVGSLLDARGVHPGRSAAEHLRALARSNGINSNRVSEVLDGVGLADVGERQAKTFSLGMLQRLGLAAALLGDPPILVLDEPLNGLDPEGIIWFRGLMRRMAAEGRTVLVSSHNMTEMSVTADRLLIIGEGRLLIDSDMHTFQLQHEHEAIRVCTPDAGTLRGAVVIAGGQVRDINSTTFAVSGLEGSTIGALALDAGVQLNELAPVRQSLEDAFMQLTASGANSAAPAPVVSTPATSARPGSQRPYKSALSTRPANRFRSMVGSELLKLRSTRAAPLIVAGTLAASLATAVLFANSVGDRYPDFDVDQLRSFDPTHTILRGRSFMQFTLGVLGALAVTAEHGTGTIVPSLAAVPNRTRFFAAKTTAVTGISLPTGLVATTGAFLAGQMMLQRRGVPHDDFLSHGSVRAVLGGGLHATASALLGFGTGTLTRTTAGAIATIVATQLFVPGIAPAFPSPISDILVKYWPTEAGARILATRPDPKLLGPWAGLGVMAASTAVVLGAALASFHQRDI